MPRVNIVKGQVGAMRRERARQLREAMTPMERRLWQAVRDDALDGLHIRRQQTLGPFIADFYHAPSCLVIEVDGGIHEEQTGQDAARTAYFAAGGIRVLRLPNDDVQHQLPTCLVAIQAACVVGKVTPPPARPP